MFQNAVDQRASSKLTIVNLNDAQLKDPAKVDCWENSLAASVRQLGGSACVDFIINGGDLFDKNLKVSNVSVGTSIKWAIVLDPVQAFYNGVPFISSSPTFHVRLKHPGIFRVLCQRSSLHFCFRRVSEAA